VGCTFSPWQRAPHRTSLDPAEDLLKDWEVSNPIAMLTRVRDRFLAGPVGDFAADTAAAIDTVRPDAVIADYLLFGSVLAAQAAGLPVAALVPNIWMIPTRGVPSVGPGFAPAKTALGRGRDAALLAVVNRLFKRGLPTLNEARAAHGLGPVAAFYDQVLDADRILVLSSAAFDFAAPYVPDNVRYLGPVLDEPEWVDPWTPPWPATCTDPLVLVGFSSTFQRQGPLLQRVVDALSSMPVRAVVTLGQMLDDGTVRSSENVTVVRSAPHSQIIADASLVISHCGHGTTMKTLAAGVPMVCIPMGRDQNDTAARVKYHGAGVRLSPNASVDKIRGAVERVLHDDSYRINAQRLAAAIAEEQHDADLVGELEALADRPRSGRHEAARTR
jgi:MGT family glycosyltransferase